MPRYAVRGPDWKQARVTITEYLGRDEPAELSTAFVPPPDHGDGGLVIPGLMPLAWAVRYLRWKAAVRKASRAAQLPLTRKMIVALTPRRLVIWQATSRWRLGELAGDLPLDQITGIAVSGSGPRSRVLTLTMAAGTELAVRVAPEMAGLLRAARR